MKNFIFISPNYPSNYWNFCKQLKDNGCNVLGIGDCPFDKLSFNVKENLTEYYKVSSLENYAEVYRAVAFFIFKYGKIDWIESNNEYWLKLDAKLRDDYNIKSGYSEEQLMNFATKTQRIKYYELASLPHVRYCISTTQDDYKKFIAEVGYPVTVRSNYGRKVDITIFNDAQLNDLFFKALPYKDGAYIMEECPAGEVLSYDAIVNENGALVFETGNNVCTYKKGDDPVAYFYMVDNLSTDVQMAGRALLSALKIKSRFIHFEFYRLHKDCALGKQDDIIGKDISLCPSGGITPDMMNYANSTNVYKLWADTICFGNTSVKTGTRYYCAFACRYANNRYAYSENDIRALYSSNIKIMEKVPKEYVNIFGDRLFIATFNSLEEIYQFYEDVSKPHK